MQPDSLSDEEIRKIFEQHIELNILSYIDLFFLVVISLYNYIVGKGGNE